VALERGQVEFRQATVDDAALLARMNAELIRDEGHRNPMNMGQLRERMQAWLAQEYTAVIFAFGAEPVGYALYSQPREYLYLRQFYIRPQFRRRGWGRQALDWLREHRWKGVARVRVEVLAGNQAGLAFWKAAGFEPYSQTLEWP
jgi:ribosomal protein S18 acetylase RimI-like enzyme